MDPDSPLHTRLLKFSTRRLILESDEEEVAYRRAEEITHSDCANGNTSDGLSSPRSDVTHLISPPQSGKSAVADREVHPKPSQQSNSSSRTGTDKQGQSAD